MMAELWERNRIMCLGAILMCLLAITTLYYTWIDWGLITIHAQNEPVSKIIKSIEWQGWVKIESSLDPNTQVTMDVDEVTLPEAMESLAANSDSRWKLSFFLGEHKSVVMQGMQVFSGGLDLHDNGWRTFSSFGGGFQLGTSEDDPVPDPYLQKWNVKVEKPDLQGYLQASAQAADVAIFVPQDWNPTLASPGAYPNWSISSGIAELAYKAGGTYQEVLTLQSTRRPRRDENRPRPDNQGDRFGGFDQDAMWDRMDNVINGLPSSAQPAARQRLADEKTFMASLATMSPDDRRKAMMEHMAENMDKRNLKNNPLKRAARYAQMISVKSAAMNIASSGGGRK